MAQRNEGAQPLESISQDVLPALQLENEAYAEELDDEGEAESVEEDDDMDLFRPLLDTLKLDKLADLAVRNRQGQESQDAFPPTAQVNLRGENRPKLSCEVISPPILGAYNAVYTLQFSDGVKWIARIPGRATPPSSFSALDARMMDTDLRSMQFTRKNTSIPIPEVFAWETTSDSIGAPYALMSFVPGKSISSVWFDDAWTSESKRTKVLGEIAKYMSQFHSLKFDKIGALCFDDQQNVVSVESFVELDAPDVTDELPWGNTYAAGPFETTRSFLLDDWDDNNGAADWRLQELQIVRAAVESIPETLMHDGCYTLTPPDFDSQNIFVDDDGNVTGFIDWDSVKTQPRVLGYCRYPTFITRDWDPAMYAYGEPDANRENSPEELSRYRQIYADAFARIGLLASDFSADDTKLSHIVEAIEIAAGSRICRSGIVEKLLDHAFRHKVPFTYPELMDALEKGEGDNWMRQIRDHFSKMWYAEWEEEDTIG
jgi:aminoglycoside phosphotransferase (APT) family kinase protein